MCFRKNTEIDGIIPTWYGLGAKTVSYLVWDLAIPSVWKARFNIGEYELKFLFLAGISGINSNIKNCDIPQFGFFMWPLDLILASRQTISHILAHELGCLELIQTYKSTLDKHIYWCHAHSISWASMWLIAWRADQFSVSECDRVLQKSHWDWVTVTLILVALYDSCFRFLRKININVMEKLYIWFLLI